MLAASRHAHLTERVAQKAKTAKRPIPSRKGARLRGVAGQHHTRSVHARRHDAVFVCLHPPPFLRCFSLVPHRAVAESTLGLVTRHQRPLGQANFPWVAIEFWVLGCRLRKGEVRRTDKRDTKGYSIHGKKLRRLLPSPKCHSARRRQVASIAHRAKLTKQGQDVTHPHGVVSVHVAWTIVVVGCKLA